MPIRDVILDPAEIDYDTVVADINEIRSHNPQRYLMEQLTAIVYDDPEANICAGYRDLTPEEFWVPGHMPGMPLMPGVVMCEAAAQVCSFHTQRHDLLGAVMVGFGGLDKVRFRGLVRPGDRLLVMCEKLKLRRGRMITCRFQCFVGTDLKCDGELSGIPLPVDNM
ncbi:MAG: 3-hydroxyacyl-ACP dehydratase FabZ family protein [Lacipirellulaceae bacterium]